MLSPARHSQLLRLISHHINPSSIRHNSSSSSSPPTHLFNILFCGSDDFSIGTLEPLLKEKDLWKSLQVVTGGEKITGRGGKKVVRPPLYDYAEKRGLIVHQVPPSGMKEWKPPPPFDAFFNAASSTSSLPSDILITSSFGHIIPLPLLNSYFPSPSSRLNCHPSLLPKFRGAAPIQWTIATGQTEGAVSVQSLGLKEDEVGGSGGVDTGLLWGQSEGIPISDHDTYKSLLPRLANLNGRLLVDVLRGIQAGTASSRPQDHSSATRARKITRESARIDFTRQGAVELDRLHRGFSHQHPLWTTLNGKVIQFHDVRLRYRDNSPESLAPMKRLDSMPPGSGLFDKRPPGGCSLLIRCAATNFDSNASEGMMAYLEVRSVQEEGRKVMSVGDWWNGVGKEERSNRCVVFGT